MKRAAKETKPRLCSTHELTEAQLDEVKGGALNAYMTMHGETQGTSSASSESETSEN